MIRDTFLRMTTAAGQRPVPVGNPADFQPAPFPTGFGGDVSSVDLGAIQDWGRGRSVKARFRVTENFAEGNADWRAFFGILVARHEDLNVGARLIAQSGPNDGTTVGFLVGGLTVGVVVELPVPTLDSFSRVSDDGFQFMGLCMSIKSPTAPATAGLVVARFVLDSDEESFADLRFPATGFEVQ